MLGATGGYLLGFLARLGARRRPRRSAAGTVASGGSLGAMLLGTLIIYAFGLAWLALALETQRHRRAALRPLSRSCPATSSSCCWPRASLPLGWRLAGRRASIVAEGRPTSLMAAIVTESLSKRYGGHGRPFHRGAEVRALHDLSIEVARG